MPHTEPPDETLQLQIDRANARSRMKEVHSQLTQLKNLIEPIQKEYMRWYKRYHHADRILAETDGRVKKLKDYDGEKKPAREVTLELTREQIMSIAQKLGVALELPKEVLDEKHD